MEYMEKKKIFNDVSVDDLTHLPDVSSYNNNYYIYKNYLLCGVSNDDTETEWFLVSHDKSNDFLGYSYVSKNPEKIIVMKEIQ